MSWVNRMNTKLDQMERLFPSLSSEVGTLKKDLLLLWTIIFWMPHGSTREFFKRKHWGISGRNYSIKSRILDIELNSATPIATVDSLITDCMLDMEDIRRGTKELYAIHLEKEYDGNGWGLDSDGVREFIKNLVEVQQEVLDSNDGAVIAVENLRPYLDLSEHLVKVCENKDAIVTMIWRRARAVADYTAIYFYSILVQVEPDTCLDLKLTHLLLMTDPTHPGASAFYFKIFNSLGLSHQIPFPETEKTNVIDHLLLYLKNRILHCQNPSLLRDYSEKLIVYETLMNASVSYSLMFVHNNSTKMILYENIIKHATTVLSFSFFKDLEEKSLDESFDQFVDQLVKSGFIGHLFHYYSKLLKGQLAEFSEYMNLLKIIVSYPPLRYMFSKMILQKVIVKLVTIVSSLSSIDTEVEDYTRNDKNSVLHAKFDVSNLVEEYEKFMEDFIEIHDLQPDMKHKLIGEQAIGQYIDGLEEVQKQYLSSNELAIISVQNIRTFQHLSEVIVKWHKDEDLMNNLKSQLLVVVEHTTLFLCSCWINPEENQEFRLTQLLQMTTIKDPNVRNIYVQRVMSLTRSEYSPWPDEHALSSFIDHLLNYNNKSLKAQLEEFSGYMSLLKVIASHPPLRYMLSYLSKIILQNVIAKLVMIVSSRSSIDTEEKVEDDTGKENNLVLTPEFDVANLIDEYEKFMEEVKGIHDLQVEMKCEVIGEQTIGQYIDGLEEVQKQFLSSNKEAIVSIQYLRSFQHLNKVIVKWYIDEELMNNLKSQLLVVVEHTTIFLCSCWIGPEENQEFKLTQLLQITTIKHPNVRSIYVHRFKSLTRTEYSPWPDKHVVGFIDHLLFYLKELIQCETKSIVASSKEKLENLHRYLIDLRKMVAVEDIESSSRVQLMPSRMESLQSLVIKFVMAMATFCISDLDEDAGKKNIVLLDELEKNITLMKTELRKSITFDYPSVGGEFFSIFMNLEDLLSSKTDLFFPIKHELDMVYREMLKVKSFLEKRIEKKEQVKDLQQRVNKVSYQLDFMIQSYMNKDGPTYYHALQISVLREDFQLLVSEMKAHDTDASNYATTEETYNKPGSSEGSSSNATDIVVGFDDESEKILAQVKGNSPNRDIIAIVGMPGLGKTTMAKKVYNNSSVANHFDRRAWCCVSQSYQTRELLLQILRSIIVVNENQMLKMNDEDIAKLVSQNLKQCRYLIVLDDVWETKAWEDLRRSFPDGNNRSRVIVTSRNLHVAQTLIQATSNGYVHPLRVFHDEESRELLEEKLFPKAKFPKELCDAAMKIAQQCKGLPLTVVLEAGILSKMEKKKDLWVEFGRSLGSLIFNEEGNQCRNMIELSYTHLPDHLKCCFLYFGAFPEDKVISATKLAWLWIAEGFVGNANPKRLEDRAEDYLMELIKRSLVIGSTSAFSPRIKSCHVHDLLRDFCIAKAEEENFLQVVRGYDKVLPLDMGHFDYGVDSGHAQDPSKIGHLKYRLSIYSKRKHFILAKPSGPNARTLFFHAFADMHPNCQYDSSFISRYFKLIKVLELGSINIGDSLADVALMLHLKYLAVKGSIESIPETIDNLWKLETLIIRGSRLPVICVPNSIWNLLKLRHLHIDGYTSIKFSSNGIPESTILADMESFSTPTISYGDDVEEMLRRFPNLRKLKCIFLDSWNHFKKCNQFPVLEFQTQLVSLKVSCDHKPFNSAQRYPCRFSFPSNLTKLTLSEFDLPWSEISAIGRLPNLNALKLLSRAFTGKTWVMGKGDDFPTLKVLKLESLDVEEWSATEEHFPMLERLMLSKCKNIKKIPSVFADIGTLEIIEVLWCNPSAGTSARSIQETAVDDGNDSLKVRIYPNEENPGASS